LRVESITKTYGSRKVLDDVNLEFQKGEMVGLLGPNGAGKTTLLKIIYDTTVEFQGSVYFNLPPRVGGSIVGVCPQHNVYWPVFTVREHLKFFAILMGDEPTQLPRWITHISNMALIDERMLSKFPAELSGGMLRKLAISLSLVVNSSIVILDEPTAGIDVAGRKNIWNSLQSLRRIGSKNIIFSSHSLSEVT
jgi:ABC-2 type transport system ATP-binding protein